MNDWELLRDYFERGSETAFEALVKRHVDMVYATAVRQVRDWDAARDVTQAVFILLARKASGLRPSVILGGWLYQTTRLMACRAVRTRIRQQRREREAMLMQPDPATDELWETIVPHLDAALADLGGADRNAIVLRYLQRRSFAEVAQSLGLSEDAAKKRVGRALEKLRVRLARCRAEVAAITLGTLLTSRASPAAPVNVVGAAVKAGVNSGAGTLATATALELAGGTAAITATLEFVTLLTSAKVSTLLAALGVFLFVGASVAVFFRANATDRIATGPSASMPALPAAVLVPKNRMRTPSGAPSPVGINAQTKADLAAALAKVQAVLNDPQPTRSFPNHAMREAIAALGEHRQAAIPVLRQALEEDQPILTSWQYQVRRRAMDGLGLVGRDAADTAPALLKIIRTDTSLTGTIDILVALGQIGPLPVLLPDLVQVLQEKPDGDSRQWIAHFLETVVGRDSAKVDEWVRPLLAHTNSQVRAAAAYAWIAGFKRPAGPEVIKVATEFLKADDQSSGMATQGMLQVLQSAVQDPHDPARVIAARLGAAADDTIAALVHVANHSRLKDVKTQALRLLDGLAPGLRQQNPGMDTLLGDEERLKSFTVAIRNEQVTLTELIGLTHGR